MGQAHDLVYPMGQAHDLINDNQTRLKAQYRHKPNTLVYRKPKPQNKGPTGGDIGLNFGDGGIWTLKRVLGQFDHGLSGTDKP